jgi:uncharacterized protein YbbC (DUF1343 family)
LPPPYEYEYEKMPVDILLGDGRVRGELEKGVSIWEMEERWLAGLKVFERLRQEILIYEEA